MSPFSLQHFLGFLELFVIAITVFICMKVTIQPYSYIKRAIKRLFARHGFAKSLVHIEITKLSLFIERW